MRGQGWLLDNLGLKLFAVTLALLLYLHVLTDRTAEEVVYFPLEIEGLADSLALAADPPAQVGVLLRGTGKQLLRLRYVKPALTLDLGGVTAGTYQRAFAPGDVPLEGTTGVTVVEVRDPTAVRLEVAPRAARTVAVAANLIGTPARGYTVAGRPRLRPAEVQLSGPRAWMARQDNVATESINIQGKRDTFELVQPIVPPPDWAHVSPGSVLVEVPIEAEVVRTLELGVEVRAIRGLLRAEVRPAAVRAAWRGPRSRGERLRSAAFQARVDTKRRGRGTWVLPVEVTGPGAEALTVQPESVTVVLH